MDGAGMAMGKTTLANILTVSVALVTLAIPVLLAWQVYALYWWVPEGRSSIGCSVSLSDEDVVVLERLSRWTELPGLLFLVLCVVGCIATRVCFRKRWHRLAGAWLAVTILSLGGIAVAVVTFWEITFMLE
jgi:hypothetical protein